MRIPGHNQLWLGTRLGDQHDGSGRLVRVDAGALWTVGLHRKFTEVHQLPTPAEAEVRGDPAAVYRWLWGRAADQEVVISGDVGAAAELRQALALSMR